MVILGISAFYHDSAAALIKDGRILAAAQEERFTRVKHDSSFPIHSINFCLKYARINPSSIDHIVFYEKPFIKFERLFETYLAFAPSGFESFRKVMPLWLKDKLFQKRKILNFLDELWHKNPGINNKLLFSEHHLSHAASAFYPSPFKNAAVLTMDGVGEWATSSIALGSDNSLKILKEIHFPHSIGLLYSAFTYFCGFKVNSGEYKLMGLAPYGKPKYAKKIKEHLIEIKEDGSYQLNMQYFNYCVGFTMVNSKFHELFGITPREAESPLRQIEMDLAASIQIITEEIVLNSAKYAFKITKSDNLCLAGGVALNCVANGKLSKEDIFKNIWIQPASGDSGGAIGAAYVAYYNLNKQPRLKSLRSDLMQGSFLGPSYSSKQIIKELNALGAVYSSFSIRAILKKTALALSQGQAVGWFAGRMEFGPRALGARSILADPRSPLMQKQLNLKIKFRESFRPFAPSILREDLDDFFELKSESPYMLFVGNIKINHRLEMTQSQNKLFGIDKINIPRSTIPAVTHVDYSARVQTVDVGTNPKFHSLISRFKQITGVPVLVNTSFNVRGEPIVCSPSDAYRCFMGNGLDVLVIENQIMYKSEQPVGTINSYHDSYELD
jgi:carbamoyltransferase